MYAVIETGGKQLTVREGDVVRVELLKAAAGDTVTLDRVLLLGDGAPLIGAAVIGAATIGAATIGAAMIGAATIGAPTVAGASVSATVLRQGRGRKITVMKYKAKAHYRRKTGHRQGFTELRIERIAAPGR